MATENAKREWHLVDANYRFGSTFLSQNDRTEG